MTRPTKRLRLKGVPELLLALAALEVPGIDTSMGSGVNHRHPYPAVRTVLLSTLLPPSRGVEVSDSARHQKKIPEPKTDFLNQTNTWSAHA